MLCGYPPFGGKSEEEIFKKIKRGNLIFDRLFPSNLSNGMESDKRRSQEVSEKYA